MKRKAHWKTVDGFSMFERWVLAEMPNSPYALFLTRCNDLAEGDNLPFQAPPVSLVATYMDDVRQFPSKAGTVKTYLAAISSTCTEFGASPPCSLPDVKEQMSMQACCKVTRMSVRPTPMLTPTSGSGH